MSTLALPLHWRRATGISGRAEPNFPNPNLELSLSLGPNCSPLRLILVPIFVPNSNMDLVKQALHIASDPRQNRWICPLILLADAALCCLVVWKVPCTCPNSIPYLFLEEIRRMNLAKTKSSQTLKSIGLRICNKSHNT